ncbi:MAG TPA: DUF4230 domain-containing protein [Thermoanaerobaculia bacterium]
MIVAVGLWTAYRAGRRAGPERASAAPVVQAMRTIAQLATVEIQVSDVVRYEEVKTILLIDFPKSATLRLRGRVLGGFDLASRDFAVEADAVRRTVRVRLPRPRLLAIDPRFEWFDEKDGWINPITTEDRNRWMVWARGALGRAAKDAGLEARAAEHARQLLGAGATALGWTADVRIADEDRLPPAPAATETSTTSAPD